MFKKIYLAIIGVFWISVGLVFAQNTASPIFESTQKVRIQNKSSKVQSQPRMMGPKPSENMTGNMQNHQPLPQNGPKIQSPKQRFEQAQPQRKEMHRHLDEWQQHRDEHMQALHENMQKFRDLSHELRFFLKDDLTFAVKQAIRQRIMMMNQKRAKLQPLLIQMLKQGKDISQIQEKFIDMISSLLDALEQYVDESKLGEYQEYKQKMIELLKQNQEILEKMFEQSQEIKQKIQEEKDRLIQEQQRKIDEKLANLTPEQSQAIAEKIIKIINTKIEQIISSENISEQNKQILIQKLNLIKSLMEKYIP